MELAWECVSPKLTSTTITSTRSAFRKLEYGSERLSICVTQWPNVMFLIAGVLVIKMIATTLIIFWQQRMMEVIIFLCLTRWTWLKSVSHPTAPSYVFRSVTVPNCFVLPSTSVQHESFFCRSYFDWNNPDHEKSNNSVLTAKVQFVKILIDNVLALRYYPSTFSLCWPAPWWFTDTAISSLAWFSTPAWVK